MNEYDIGEAFEAIEDRLIKSMMRNMARHRVEEIAEEKEWSMWQAEQLKALEKYKKANQKAFQKEFSKINESISDVITQARQQGSMEQEIEILEAIKGGFKPTRALTKNARTVAEFFRLNDRKLEALIKATKQDLQKAEVAMLRMANDQYRKIIFNAQVYANTGASTYAQAVDMASKDFLAAGINCIEYKNGARVGIAAYAQMALQTASKRAYFTGEGEKRQEWGIATVIMNKRGAACPKCIPFVGKILIDDVWSGGKASDGPYPLMSAAIAKGLYHPNCKDSHTTYFEGITTPPKQMTQADIDRLSEKYREEQQQKYAERMAKKYKTLKEGSLDKENRGKYELRETEWKSRLKESENSRKGVNRKTVIDRSVINSSQYRKKFDVLGEKSEIVKILYAESKKALYHRSGTEFEDLVFINAKTGETLRSINYEKVREAKPTKKMVNMLSRSGKNEIIAIHNHPNSMPPSISDLMVAKERGYKYGLVACHDGKIYKYDIQSKINEPIARLGLDLMSKKGYNKNEFDRALEILKDAGVEMVVL